MIFKILNCDGNIHVKDFPAPPPFLAVRTAFASAEVSLDEEDWAAIEQDGVSEDGTITLTTEEWIVPQSDATILIGASRQDFLLIVNGEVAGAFRGECSSWVDVATALTSVGTSVYYRHVSDEVYLRTFRKESEDLPLTGRRLFVA